MDEKGLNLQTMPSWKLSNNKHDKNIHTKIFFNPKLFQQLSSVKNKSKFLVLKILNQKKIISSLIDIRFFHIHIIRVLNLKFV